MTPRPRTDRGRRRLTGLAVVAGLVVAAAGTALAGGGVAGLGDRAGPVESLSGRVVDETGRPVPSAELTVDGTSATSDDDGQFRLEVSPGAHLLRAEAVSHLPRAQAVEAGSFADVLLTSRADETVSLRFTGDVMFGRRFLDPAEDASRRDAHLPPGATAQDHVALLRHVRPLLADADLTVVNLESPILDDPFVDPTRSRPPDYHRTKEFVFASAPEAVEALGEAGVDVVSLGNNHVYDALGAGLDRTLRALDDAGIPRFGAGRTVAEAWTPAVVDVKGQRFAFLACTTITGAEHEISYVADDDHGGAARCTDDQLRTAVATAAGRSDVVVVMIHGGEEYENQQTDVVRRHTETARSAGAAIVVNGHPHVVGGVAGDEDHLVVESTGNFLFDQTVWPTFLSYLVRVDVRDGAPVVTTVDPLLLEDFVPRPTVGLVADAAARKAAGLVASPVRLRPPGAVLLAVPTSAGTREGPMVERALPAGTVVRLAPGWWLESSTSDVAGVVAAAGEDLLWSTGSFEDSDVDRSTAGGHLWALGEGAELTARAACSGAVGVAMGRGPASPGDTVVTPQHRQLVDAGAQITLMAEVRSASAGSLLELRWYPDTKGPSSAVTTVAIPETRAGARCIPVRLDAVVPAGAVSVQPFVRLVPPAGLQCAARLEVDDIRLILWAEPGRSGRLFDTVGAPVDVTVSLRHDGAAGPDDGPLAARTAPVDP